GRCSRTTPRSPARGAAPHRVLPSFPTRRSSDLRTPGRWPISCCSTCRGNPIDGAAAAASPVPRCDEPAAVYYTGKATHRSREERSEEHTSELQSRENLVCRLLLEKKTNTARRLH